MINSEEIKVFNKIQSQFKLKNELKRRKKSLFVNYMISGNSINIRIDYTMTTKKIKLKYYTKTDVNPCHTFKTTPLKTLAVLPKKKKIRL
jgi:hypothetical protein